MKQEVERLIELEATAIANIPVTDQYEKVIQIIENRVHQQKGKLLPVGWEKPVRSR